MDTILEILETIKPGADFAASTDFIEEHLLESMEILQLVSELAFFFRGHQTAFPESCRSLFSSRPEGLRKNSAPLPLSFPRRTAPPSRPWPRRDAAE